MVDGFCFESWDADDSLNYSKLTIVSTQKKAYANWFTLFEPITNQGLAITNG